MSVPIITLNDGNMIPQFGLLVSYSNKEEVENDVKEDLKAGFRHIHTTHNKNDQISVGKAIKNSEIPRTEIFITSELCITEYGEDVTSKAIDEMLKRFNIDYIDLLLIAEAFNDYVGAYKAMERAKKEGKVKSIGLHNFTGEYLDEILNKCDVKPAILYVEAHPHCDRRELIQKLEPYGTKIETSTHPELQKKFCQEDDVFKCIQKDHKEYDLYSILCSWYIQKGFIALRPYGMIISPPLENIKLDLTNQEMEDIAGINKNKLYCTFSREDRKKLLEMEFNIKIK